MEGRRVSRRKPRRNPLYVLFMGLLALSLVLLITVVVLGFKLKSARSDLAAAQTKIEQLRGGQQTGEDGQTVTGEDGSITGENDVSDPAQGDNMSGDNQTGGDTIDWLDLTGHDEVSVKPNSVYDKYYIYYTTGGVNLRSGPGTSYDKVTTVSLGSEVQAAAKQDGGRSSAWTVSLAGSTRTSSPPRAPHRNNIKQKRSKPKACSFLLFSCRRSRLYPSGSTLL